MKERSPSARLAGLGLEAAGAALWLLGAIVLFWGFSQTGFLETSIAVASGAGIIAAGTLVFNQGRRRRVKSVAEALAGDSRPPILYLRSFREDKAAAKTGTLAFFEFFRTEEEQLAEVLRQAGPVIAIGSPKEPLPHLGAARMNVGDAEWKQVVLDLMKRSQLVVLRAGDTDAFWWEVENGVQSVNPERLVFLLPRDAAKYGRFRERFSRHIRHTLPASLPMEDYLKVAHIHGSQLWGTLSFDKDWKPLLLPLVRPPNPLRISVTQPLRPLFNAALRPAMERLGVPWRQPFSRFFIVVGLFCFGFPAVAIVVGYILELTVWRK